MTSADAVAIRAQLVDRKQRIEHVLAEVGRQEDYVALLDQVDDALSRLDLHTLGTCRVCSEEIDTPDLVAHPSLEYCLCKLSDEQQRLLEHDLSLASRIQWSLLPPLGLAAGGWETAFRYEPAGAVSGDLLLVVASPGNTCGVDFLIGDVSGKGVASAMIMAHLSAFFRSAIEACTPVPEIVDRANRMLLESKISSHYATLIAGRADADGAVELANAGHPPPFTVKAERVEEISSTGFPIGLVGGGKYQGCRFQLAPGESLVLYTDGVSEAEDGAGREFGRAGVQAALAAARHKSPCGMASALLAAVTSHRSGPRQDDTSLLVLRRLPNAA